MKQRTGYVFFDKQRGHFIARITWTDSLGKRRNKKQKVDNKTEGKRLLKQWATQLDSDTGERVLDATKMTFKKLAEEYAQRKLIAPKMRGTERIAGLRSYRVQLGYLKVLLETFGARRITSITHSDLESFREARLQTKTYRGTDRSAAHVHRELALLRGILNYAKRQGWLTRTPFEMGEPVIRAANEVHRDRTLSPDEETRLLAACTGKRAHLRCIVIGLVDTALRKGELLALEWRDVDLDAGLIAVRGETTKTLKDRKVGITARLRVELNELAKRRRSPTDKVFPQGDFKRAFSAACKAAGIQNLRAHDLRHSGVTRWIQSGMPVAEVMRLSGHRTLNVAFRYINADDSTARRAAEAMDNYQVKHAEQLVASEFVN